MVRRDWTPWPGERFGLGEGLRHVGGRLVMTDILTGRLLSLPPEPVAGPEVLVQLDEPLGAVAPLVDGGWIAAAGRGVAVLGDPVRWLARPAAAGMRMNDGAADPAGRFWAGSMAYDNTAGAGVLYRVDPDGTVTAAVRDITVPNGPAFDAAGTTMYLADSARKVIHRFAIDPATGEPGQRAVFARVREGSPDGMTVDAEGFVWSAIWGGGQVVRFAPDGTVDRVLPVPATQPTSVCLTGSHLVVTSAAHGLATLGPLDGAVLATPCGVRPVPVRVVSVLV
ncbi:SMP-30/gluconolactonase/LRE family protein [Amycolatopsis acidicola]|uniref:SMP-30/gluconolactonase/LRE family protein n=1 Tax=Amycolatopsis acidicola TaxID=2596893 RepID=A0A5N0UWN5_9PSEU|nr:SMP-30/gluconolactonase/LRE family protein [Amycolatopsis acidicola]KAA9155400.1 SMP-30/gluconolactonase/LRE family protein [Amycolatopsis acidicola]